jgi:plastocyanin
MRRGAKAAAAGLVAAAAIVLPLGGASASKHRSPKPVHVTIKDNFYSPSKIKQKKGGKVVWKWSNANTQSHNVTLQKAPKGVKKNQFRSNTASSDFTFKKKFTKPGKYHFVCTIHPETMVMDLTVKR